MKGPHPRSTRHPYWIIPLALLLITGAPAASESPAQDETKLQEHMGKNQRAFLRIRKWAKDPAKNEKTLEQIVSLQGEFLQAKSLIPKKASTLTGKERAAFLTAYRKGIIEMISMDC